MLQTLRQRTFSDCRHVKLETELFRNLLINVSPSQLKMEIKQTQKCKGQNRQQNSMDIKVSWLWVHVFYTWSQISTASIWGVTGIDIYYSVFTKIPEDVGPVLSQALLPSECNYIAFDNIYLETMSPMQSLPFKWFFRGLCGGVVVIIITLFLMPTALVIFGCVEHRWTQSYSM